MDKSLVVMDSPLMSFNMRFWRSRETLLRPVLWMAQDLDSFNCHFGAIKISEAQGYTSTEYSSTTTDSSIIDEVLELAKTQWSLSRVWSFASILTGTKLYRISRTRPPPRPPPLRVGKLTIRHPFEYCLLCPVKRPRVPSDLPLTGFVDWGVIDFARNAKNQREYSRPEHRNLGFYERLALIQPKEWSADPCVLGILLSIAQYQYYRTYYRTSGRRKRAYRACLFVSNLEDEQDIFLFDATIATTLLNQLNDPRTIPKQMPRTVIHRTRITMKPYETFQARLVAMLSAGGGDASDSKDRGIAGEVGDVTMATTVAAGEEGDEVDDGGGRRQTTRVTRSMTVASGVKRED